MVHTIILTNVSCFVFLRQNQQDAKGWLFLNKKFSLTQFSYDGIIFHNQADSTIAHQQTTLAKIDAAPLAVGGYPSTNKAEIYNISSNSWTEVAAYPYHS